MKNCNCIETIKRHCFVCGSLPWAALSGPLIVALEVSEINVGPPQLQYICTYNFMQLVAPWELFWTFVWLIICRHHEVNYSGSKRTNRFDNIFTVALYNGCYKHVIIGYCWTVLRLQEKLGVVYDFVRESGLAGIMGRGDGWRILIILQSIKADYWVVR